MKILRSAYHFNRVNAKPAANPAFFDVPSRTILITLLGSIRRILPALSITYPRKKVVATVIAAAGIMDEGWLRKTSRFNPTTV